MKSAITFCFLMLTFSCLPAQFDPNVLDDSYRYRNIGPANQGGRIVDVEAVSDDFRQVYIAAASGGVWKSSNAGTTWKPIFDTYKTASIGDISLDPNNANVLWVGTGESNNRNSVSWGDGIYKSTDGGDSFTNMGLESTHQIARVSVNPKNSDEVCACAIGHLWGYSGDRGLFITKNGGKEWKKLTNGLPDDGKTGCIDFVRDPRDPNVMYTAFYHRIRKSYSFHSGGSEGGIFKSTDGGRSWEKLTQGLPTGPTGRIGLAIYEKNPDIVMAIVEAERTDDLTKPGTGVYRSEDGGMTWTYTNTYNNRPFYYSQIRINPHDDQRVYVLTTRFMVSEDGGQTFSNGSKDQEVHGDFHAMWLDPNHKDRYYLGADKGFSLTHDHGKHFQLIDNLPIAQFYRINHDMRDPYYVYGGLQDNGSYATASFSRDARGILNDSNWKMHWGDGQDVVVNPFDYTDMYSSMENGAYLKYNPKTREIYNISPNSFNTINFGDYYVPGKDNVKEKMRYNWSAPSVISPHDPNVIYIGGNHVLKTIDKGESWEIISPDLTTNDPNKINIPDNGGLTPESTGAETHCSITNIAPSEIDRNVIWASTDDGNVHYTMDGGIKWTKVNQNITGLPPNSWSSKLVASAFDVQTAYVSFDNHRSDDFGTYLYKTTDMGKTWKKITKGFEKGETVRVIREDIKTKNLLFAGTETGVWMSIDSGEHWNRLRLNMPTVSVYDLRIHPRENDLIVGTHGRSLWILDDISALQSIAEEGFTKDVKLYDTQKVTTLWHNVSRGGQRGHFIYAGENPLDFRVRGSKPRANIQHYASITYEVGENVRDSIKLEITSNSEGLKRTVKLPGNPGIQRYYWDRKFDLPSLLPEDVKDLKAILRQLNNEFDASRLRNIVKKLDEVEDSYDYRKLIAPITSGYINYSFDSKYLIPEAQAGSYKVTISTNEHIDRSVLVIRDDPMKN